VGGHLMDWGAAAAFSLLLHLLHFLVHPGPQTELHFITFYFRVCPKIFLSTG